MRKIKNLYLYDIIVFMTIWVYFSLNANYIDFPGSHILRWVFPGILIILGIMRNGGRIIKPPGILIWISIAVFPSIIFSSYANIAFIKYLSIVVILYGSYIFFCYLNNKKLLVRYFDIFITVIIIFQILNFIFVILGINYDSGRALGITTNSNTLGVYSNLSYLAIIYLLFNKIKSKTSKIVYFGLLLTSVYTSIASGSRAAFIVLIINILASLFLKFKRSPFMLFCFIIAGVFFYIFISDKIDSLNIVALNRLIDEGTSRADLWNVAISVWEKHQIFGVGYTVSNYYNLLEKGMAFHNSYISYLVETGVWGVIFLSIGFIVLIIKIWNTLSIYKYRASESRNALFFACFMGLSLLIAAWSESFLFAVGSTEGFIFWFLIAWILSYISKMCNGE